MENIYQLLNLWWALRLHHGRTYKIQWQRLARQNETKRRKGRSEQMLQHKVTHLCTQTNVTVPPIYKEECCNLAITKHHTF